MEIISLQIQNFLTIGKLSKLSLSNQGLVLIQGKNDDDTSAGSNGAGKSSIADALCWSLYGETARGETGDNIVNDVAKKDCLVKVVLKDADVTYDITRYRKHKEFKNQTVVNVWEDEDGYKFTDISKGTEKETQELINSVLGCTLDVFIAAIYAGQEEMPDLPKMTDKQLKLLIEEAAGVERLEQAYELARKDASDVQSKISALATARTNINSQRESLASKLAIATASFDLFNSGRQARSDAHKATAMTLAGETKILVTSLANKSPTALKTSLEGLQKQVAEITSRQEDYRAVLKLKADNDSRAQTAMYLVNTADNSITSCANAYKNAEVEMMKPCTECGKPHDPSEIEDFKAHKLEEQNKAIAEKQKHTKAANDILTEGNEILLALALAQREIDELNPEAIFNRTNAINAELGEIAKLESEIARKKAEIQVYVEKSKSVMTESNPDEKVLGHIMGQIDDLNANYDDATNSIKEFEKQAEVLDAVVKVFSPAGVRAHILDTVTPFLNDRTSEYLSALSDGNIHAIWTTISKTTKGDLKEKFNIEVSNDKGGKSFKLLSGGEKRKVRLSTMLALQDLVASRASKPIQLWVGDEIDDALDSAGLERLMGILDRKARERGTVLVISHNSLADWIDNVVTVTKKDGTSTIEGALCP